jgi:hypothetical protein
MTVEMETFWGVNRPISLMACILGDLYALVPPKNRKKWCSFVSMAMHKAGESVTAGWMEYEASMNRVGLPMPWKIGKYIDRQDAWVNDACSLESLRYAAVMSLISAEKHHFYDFAQIGIMLGIWSEDECRAAMLTLWPTMPMEAE